MFTKFNMIETANLNILVKIKKGLSKNCRNYCYYK